MLRESPSIHAVNACSVLLSDVGKGNPRFGRNILLLISGVQTILTLSRDALYIRVCRIRVGDSQCFRVGISDTHEWFR
jgi:hypothetical protein